MRGSRASTRARWTTPAAYSTVPTLQERACEQAAALSCMRTAPSQASQMRAAWLQDLCSQAVVIMKLTSWTLAQLQSVTEQPVHD
jgi:hypothetical protein